MSTTLHQLWPDGVLDWSQVEDAPSKQRVTVRQLLTMSSGLVNRWNWWAMPQNSLVETLNFPAFSPGSVNRFVYNIDWHIIAYVILRASGLTPLALAERTVLPALGIATGELSWATNNEGVHLSAHGMHLSPRHLAKLGQLYLQGGEAAPGVRLLDAETAARTLHNQLDRRYPF